MPPSRRLLPSHSMLALLLLSALLPLALFAWIAGSERDRALAEARDGAVRTVSALHEHAAKVFETHELVLAEVARQVEARSWEDVEGDRALWAYLTRVAAELDQVTSITLADADGRVRMTTDSFSRPGTRSVAEEEGFRYHRAGSSGSHVAALPATPGAERMVAVSRAITRDGAFRGIVQVAVPVAQFTEFWERFAPTIAHVIPLVRSDGQVIARYPGHDWPARLDPEGPFLRRALAQREGTYTAVSRVDGVERLNAFMRVKQYPLHISFSVETRAILAGWRQRIGQLGLFTALAAVALLTATALVGRQQRLQQEAAQRWREAAARLSAEMAAREQAEASLQRAETLNAVGQLTAGVAHDFNNLLQAVRGGFTLLRRPRSPDSAEAIITSGLQAVERGAKLVRQLMVFARREKLEPRPVDLRALVAGMGDLLQKAAGTGTRIEVEIPEDLHLAMVDPTQTELAVLNLVINARDAMAGREGGGRLTIAARNLSLPAPDLGGEPIEAGDYVLLSVADTGSGMPPDVLRRAMEPFFTTKPVGKGTGLGLSMVHGFATQSGGGIRIESEAGRGTVVTLYMPRVEVSLLPEHAPPAAQPVIAAPRQGATVLLVDDDALARLMTAGGLREAGHRVFEARDAEAGLEMLRAHPEVSVLVTDYAMPGMNGARLAAVARQARPDLLVMIITGHAAETPEDLERVADAVLRKPFFPEDLDARIRAAARAGRNLVDAVPGG